MDMTLRILCALLAALALAAPAAGELRTETVEYRDGETTLRGHLAWDDAAAGPRPGVVVVHEWWGLNDYARGRAEQLAGLGYVALAVDMYGDARVTEHGDQAGDWMKQITANVDRWRQRALLGLERLRERPEVDAGRIAAIGYCFGGATVMQMAYAGADLDAVVSFHGSLPVPTAGQAADIRGRVLAAHGNADAFVPAERVAAFQAALEAADVDWQFVTYGGARHAFTNPEAGKYGIENVQYDVDADRRSWALMRQFLAESLGD